MIALGPILFGLFVFLFAKVLQYIAWRSKVEKLTRNFDGPKGLSKFGLILELLIADNFLQYISNKSKNFSSPVKFWMADKLYIVVSDYKNARKILNSTETLNKAEEYRFFRFDHSIFSIQRDKWRQHRKIINTLLLNKKFVTSSYAVIAEGATKLVKLLNKHCDGSEVDVFRFCASCVVDIAFKLFFNFDYNALDAPESNEIVNKTVRSTSVVGKRFKNPIFLYHEPMFMATSLYQEEQKSNLNKFYEKLLKNKIEGLKGEFEVGRFLELILSPENSFNFLEARDNCKVLIFGAFDTTATMLTATLLLLAIHPEVQKKLYSEISENVKIHDDDKNNLDIIKKLKYLDAVCKESLRLFPPAPFVARCSSEDLKLSEDQIIPAGTSVMIDIFSLHRNPLYWGDDAHLFNPERFQTKNFDTSAFIPFSNGPRNCPGFLFAELFMKTILSSVVKSFQISTDMKLDEIDVEFSLTLKFNKKPRIFLAKRNN